MARLYVFVEGQTEQTFATTVLRPHLANFGVYLQAAILIAHAKKKGAVHRGGGRRYIPMKNDIRRFLAQERADDAFFTTMIDDGAHTAPSKRIIAVLPDYEGAKPVIGPQVAALIGLDTIRAKCPHFAAWLSRLEQLARG